jgi:hypothetical protein
MTTSQVLATVGLALAGACMAASSTLPPEVPWYVHTALSALQGAAIAVLLVVDPKDLATLNSGARERVREPEAPPAQTAV